MTASVPPSELPEPSMPSQQPISPISKDTSWVPPSVRHWVPFPIWSGSSSDASFHFTVPPPDTLLELPNSTDLIIGTVECRCYIWLIIRRLLFLRLDEEHTHNIFDSRSFALSCDAWRQLLSENYWRTQFHNAGGHEFDPHHFWKYGDPHVFGIMHPDLNTEAIVRFCRPDGSLVQMEDFSSDALKSLLYCDLMLTNVKLQFEATDDIVMRAMFTPECMSVRKNERQSLFRKSWNIVFEEAPFESNDLAVRRTWAASFAYFLQDWPKYPLPRALLQNLREIDDALFLTYESTLISFYLRTVRETLQCVPYVPVERPNIISLLPALYHNQQRALF